MNSAVINIKTDPKIKLKAQKVAARMGLSLSGMLNGYLRQLIKTETIHFSLKKEEQPSEWLVQSIKEARAEVARGDYYSFDNVKDSLDFLDSRISKSKK